MRSAPPAIPSSGKTVQARFSPPVGFERKHADSNSYAHYLRNLPLKPPGAKVKYYNGQLKTSEVYEAVVDMAIGDKNLQQCADAIMRLRAEYFFAAKEYDSISFKLTNGFTVDYSKWMEGNRILLDGNRTSWQKMVPASNTSGDFKNYLDIIFSYAGTISLSKSLKAKAMKDISIGDVFIVGGSPGHAVIVVDVAENKAGEKVFMLAQSYMPAQETQILKNPNDKSLSPWYHTKLEGNIYTPEWTFDVDQLKTW